MESKINATRKCHGVVRNQVDTGSNMLPPHPSETPTVRLRKAICDLKSSHKWHDLRYEIDHILIILPLVLIISSDTEKSFP